MFHRAHFFRIVQISLLIPSVLFLLPMAPAPAQEAAKLDTSRGDQMIAKYFADETAKLHNAGLVGVKSLDAWKKNREQLRRQLLEMLGLSPLPPKTPLKPEVTGRVERDEFTVERIAFQSRPNLYVTGNLYIPKKLTKPAPAILYVCGHARVRKDGVSFGNKAHYQHHGGWFARNGYVCLTIDTLQLGEIEGIHHGTYRYKKWWWLNRGYSPAGVEAWNCVRALDYLQSREEVDGERLGVTGRSGGGAYSWWVAAIDDRIRAAVPVAGVTDLQNHVVDGCVEGHCDCMYMVNTYRWDYSTVAALVAPRPLLISNTDRDGIFPLDGVVRIHSQVRDIYRLYGAEEDLALHITAGPHKDTQELRVHAFRWFNHYLKGDDELIEKTAVKLFEPPELKVFEKNPADEINTKVSESFVAKAALPSPTEAARDWSKRRDEWKQQLRDKSFRAWPAKAEPLDAKEVFNVERNNVRFRAIDFTSQGAIRLRLYLTHRADLEKPDLTVINVFDDESWRRFLAEMQVDFRDQLRGEQLPKADREGYESSKRIFKFPWAMAAVAPRGVGPAAWDQSERKQTQHRRRFYLLGQTLHGMQVYDVRRAVQAARGVEFIGDTPVWLQARGVGAGVALYAAMFEPDITRLDLYDLPVSHREGPYLLNVSRILDMPQAVALTAERSRVVIYDNEPARWEYPQSLVETLGWEAKQLQVRKPPDDE
ncbi:MAG: prolyl oligopeptidase family serine peptidase [Pirellulaceae bacterium]|jgi:dienelactone hydrolase|nr:prolyl oligopeptidase family serine peptidase [Pirellulaceae bacterium]MDP7020364.1 prolyl oligopeptidase family serine peptidase [Pirellulaceae bacterium]